MPPDFLEIPLFDQSAIERLRTVAGDQGPGFIEEMAQLFLDETAPALAEIRTAADLRNWKEVSRSAHSLKSSAATLGAMRLAAVCKALEVDTKEGFASEATHGLLAALFTQFDQAAPRIKGLK